MIDFLGLLPFIRDALFDWLNLFASPLKNLDMLWIIVPIWGVWVFSEFFQEKKGTSFGNAISNGATMLFVGVDWMRHAISGLAAGNLTFGIKYLTLMAISAGILIYGLAIIFLGIKANRLVRIIGMVRETTYFMVMFSPVIYGVEDFSLRTVAIILAFFPVFYIIVEIFDRLMPTPQSFEADEVIGKISSGTDNDLFGAGSQNFGSQANLQNPWPQAPQQQWPYQQAQQYRPQPPQSSQGFYPNQPQNPGQDPRQRNRGY